MAPWVQTPTVVSRNPWGQDFRQNFVSLGGFQTPPTKKSCTTPHHIPKYEIKKNVIVNYPFKSSFVSLFQTNNFSYFKFFYIFCRSWLEETGSVWPIVALVKSKGSTSWGHQDWIFFRGEYFQEWIFFRNEYFSEGALALVKCHSKGSTSWGYKLPPRHPCWGSSESSAKMSRLLANRSLAARVLVSPNQAPLYQKNLIFQQIRRQLSWGANGNKMSDEEYNGAGGKREIHVLSW